jgi:hypothetical protein
MDTLRKSIAAFCAISFIALPPWHRHLSLQLWIEGHLLRKPINSAFARGGFLQQTSQRDGGGNDILHSRSKPFPIVVMRGMGRDAWDAFFRALLPPEVLQVMGNDVLNSTFAYLDDGNGLQSCSTSPR